MDTSFNPSKLAVTVHPPATFLQPIHGRKYTLTHSDNTGELFLDIGYVFNYKTINWSARDDVTAEWRADAMGNFQLVGKVLVDIGENEKMVSEQRLNIFQKEMNTAIKGIIYGDLPFYTNYPDLLNSPILMNFISIYPEYRQVQYYGTPQQYLDVIYKTAVH